MTGARWITQSGRGRLALVAIVAGLSRAAAQENGETGGVPRAVAGALAGEVRLNGRLDEPAWSGAPWVGPLVMVEPSEGGTPTGRTRVAVLVTARAILIGVDAQDPDPSSIVAFSRERDAELGAEDHVKLILDTFANGRTGYVFAVNPLGARYDALITNAGESERKEWDTAWEVATAWTATGWTAEIRIPIQSVAYREGLSEWGFNVERRIQRRLEVSRWSSPWRAARLTQPARAGRLGGLPNFVYGAGVSIRPAVVSGAERQLPTEGTSGVLDVSADISKRLGPNTLASVTLNTDFAETEVDARRTNLTRFSLFFPEKRTFFLEGSDIFDFAPSLGHDVDLVAFHSRRIGLIGGQEAPVRIGGKLNGRVGATNFAALATRTGGLAEVAPAATLAAARVRQNVLSESTVGAIATVGDPEGRSGAWLAGADLSFRTSTLGSRHNLLLGAWGLATGRDGLSGDRTAVGASVGYPTDPWSAQVGYTRIGDGFDPSLGFVPRRGIEIFDGLTEYRWHSPVPGVRDAILEVHGRLIRDSLGRRESYSVLIAPFYLALESGDVIEFNVVPYGERLGERFPIATGVDIPEGDYEWVRYRLEGTFASKRRLSGRVTWWFGNFYNGRLTELAASLIFRPSAATALEVRAVRNSGALPAGHFEQELVSLQARVSLSTDLSFNTLIQYDNQSRLLGANARIRWQFHPLGELFVVYNRNRERADGEWLFASEQLLTKVQYAVRF